MISHPCEATMGRSPSATCNEMELKSVINKHKMDLPRLQYCQTSVIRVQLPNATNLLTFYIKQ